MKKLLFIVLLTIVIGTSTAQSQEIQKPDYAGIEKSTKDKNSQYFYKKLFARFTTADSTLTLDERRHLYYGFSFTEKYNPYSSFEKGELNKLLDKEVLTNKEMQTVVLLTGKALDQYPFNIRMREYRQYFLKKLGKDTDAALENARIEIILDAILSTGDGTSKDKAFYVIEVGNEYQLLNILGFEYGGEQSLIEGRYDYLKLQKNAYNVDGFYFDVSRSLQSLGH